MRTRVLHVCSDTNIGGAGRYVLTLLSQQELSDRFELAVACPEGDLSAAASSLGAPVFLLPGADRSFSFAAVRSLIGLMRTWRPRIVHTHGSLAGRVAAAVAGARIIYTKHGLASAAEQAVQVRSPGAVLRRVSVQLLAHRLVAVSAAVRDSLVAAGADPAKVRVIPGGVDLREYSSLAPLMPGVVGALGRLSQEKGFDVLLEALGQMHGDPGGAPRLRLGGDGPQRAALANKAEALGLSERVDLAGFVPDVPAFMAEIGLFVLPSRSEGLGLVLVEAMAAGRPVVASRIGGIPEVVVDGQTGVLVPPEDPAALRKAIRSILADPAAAKRMGTAGRLRAQALFSAERMAAQTASLYQEMVTQ